MSRRNEERGTGNETARAGGVVRAPRFVFLVLFLLLAPAAFACPVCWGNPDDPMVKSANNGIWVLLGVVAFVQIGFAALFISLWRRARAQQRFRESLHVIHPFDHPLDKGGPLS